jgi:cytochrome c-type biogenesis protein CcmF
MLLLGGAILVAFFSLAWSYALSDFSVLNVVMNSHPDHPLLYKIGAIWGNHEGSMLLWALIMGLYGVGFSLKGRRYGSLTSWTLIIHLGIISLFLWFILLTSNPFLRFFPSPAHGLGLNPLLQDPSLTIHPPILYAGYVGYSLIFSLTIGELISHKKTLKGAPPLWSPEGREPMAWTQVTPLLRQWSLLAWSFLTAGIALGSWWAYYTLGWGGWWFWDPVENASLIPWLAGTALIHCLRLRSLKREGTTYLSFLLGILPFIFSVLGTVLVRSGMVVSVHAFAKDPQRGAYLLLILASMSLGLGLIWRTYGVNSPKEKPSFWKNTPSLRLPMGILLGGMGVVLAATLYPIFLSFLTGHESIVSPLYYNLTFLPLMGGGALLMGVAPWIPLNAKEPSLKELLYPLSMGGVLLLAVLLFILWVRPLHPLLSALGYGLGLWVVGTTLPLIKERVTHKKSSPSWGLILSHVGVGILILGMTGQTVGKEKAIALLLPGERMALGPYEVKLEEVSPLQGPTYLAEQAHLSLWAAGYSLPRASLFPERRFHPLADRLTFQTAIYTTFKGDVYTALGEHRPDGRWAIHGYYNPLMAFLWLGAALMALGGIISWVRPSALFRRRRL